MEGTKGTLGKGTEHSKSGCDTSPHVLNQAVFNLRMRKGLGASLRC